MFSATHLSNKTVLVTGASGGIGRQTAITLSQAGATLVITGRNAAEVTATYHLLNGQNHTMIVADITVEDDITRLATDCPALDGIVHSAGIVEAFPAKFINRKKIDELFSVNFYAPVLIMTALFRHKKVNKNASVVFISSFAATYPYYAGALYSASKAALESYSKVLAVEHAKAGIRSNCVAPAMVKTKMFDNTIETRNQLKSTGTQEDNYQKFYLLGYGETVDVANCITYLISDTARWITGQTITLDGGFLLGLLSNPIE